MSNITLTNLSYMTRETLAQTIQSTPTHTLPANTAIIDVRDGDHIGGHIRGSTWVPSSQLDYRTPELIRALKDKEVVVFHCALSQQRGPSAALRYLRERARLVGGGEGNDKEEGKGKGDGEAEAEAEGEEEKKEKEKEQRVYVLRGGFGEWQEKYGEDEKLTEGFQKDLWE